MSMDIEQRALEAIRCIIGAYHTTTEAGIEAADVVWSRASVKEALDAFADARDDAFRQEVSEEMRVALRYLDAADTERARFTIGRFIIQPKTDPLAEVIAEAFGRESGQGEADSIRAALKSRGLEIREVGE